ncbi:hypothetical protein [Streptomyces netropsis]|uniref:WD40 repeat protein n=1 Tax=Streptomyces netropsis TaxID=55404 RepID=A0A7W7LFD0_STRNE|nr:hypothetical protein [Streptomyces netropsis]MBB4889165.1 WD40 repeat protein [Streptomyces netropsis]GGR07514.1 hypothetical protein GCM10010219_09550 [Streptomyces netropsis]
MAKADPRGDGPGRRLLIAAAVARHTQARQLDVPALTTARQQIVDIFTGPLGYTLLPQPGMNPTEDDLAQGLRALCRQEITAEDHLVVYLSCHGQILENGRHVLVAADADPADEAFLLPTVRLAEAMLLETPLRRLLLILDTCYSGQGGNQAAAAALSGMERDWSGPGDSGLVIITATRPFEQASPGAFPRLLAEAISSPATAGRLPAALDLGTVVGAMNANPARPAHQHIGWAGIGLSGPVPDFLPALPAFLPNPRHRPAGPGLGPEPSLDLSLQQAASWQYEAERREQEFQNRFLRSARAVPQDSSGRPAGVGSWWFSGRHAALTDIASWLATPKTHAPALAVTAGPGAGKTALLGLVAALTNAARRRSVPLNSLGLPRPAQPPVGSIDLALYAGGLTTRQVHAGLAAALGSTAADTDALITVLRRRRHHGDRPFAVLLDALDEAVDPYDLATSLLRPLLAASTDSESRPVRLLLGTRPHLLPLLEPGGEQALYGRASHWPPPVVVDLAEPPYADSDGLHRYTIRCLLDAEPDSPYRDLPLPRVQATAQAVVGAADGSFLVARIVAGTLAAADAPADPTDAAWTRSLPRLADTAMRKDLDTRLGRDADRARDLLRPLAYARGQGLPWEDIWAPLASAVSGHPYTDADLSWLQDQAGAYVVETQEAGRSVYRLYHQALAESLRQDRPGTAGTQPAAEWERAVHQAFVKVLSDIPYRADATRDWSRAHPYALRHLASHAVAADRMDSLASDVGYLIHSDPDTLLPALRHTRTPAGRTARDVYTASSHAHRTTTPARRRRILAVDAARYRATDLSLALNDGLSVRPRWATGGMLNPFLHSSLTGSSAVAVSTVDGVAVLVAARGGQVVVSDLTTGQATAVFSGHFRLRGKHSGVLHVACAEVDGEPVGVSHAFDGTRDEVVVWDLRSGRRRCALDDHPPRLEAMACTVVDGTPVAVTCAGLGVMVWDLRTGRRLRTLPFEGARGGWDTTLACTAIDDAPVALVAITTSLEHPERPITVWDLRTGALRAELGEASGGTRAITCTEVTGVPVAVTATNDTVTVWDLRTMTVRPSPIQRTAVQDMDCLVVDGTPLLITGESRGFGNVVNDGRLSVWELDSGRQREMRLPRVRSIDMVHCVYADGIPVAVTSSRFSETLVWDLREAPGLPAPIEGPVHPIQATACGRFDGEPVVLTAGGDDWGDELRTGEVVLWNLRDGSVVARIHSHAWPVGYAALSDGTSPFYAVTVGDEPRGSEQWVWDGGSRDSRRLGGPAGAYLVGLTNVDGRPLAVLAQRAARGQQAVILWDVAADREHAVLKLHEGPVICTRIADAPFLVTAGPNDVLTLWDLSTGKRGAAHQLPTRGVTCLAEACRDGIPSVTVAFEDASLAVIDLLDGRCAASFELPDRVKALTCTGTLGEPLAALVTVKEPDLIEVRDLETGNLREAVPAPYPVESLTFAANGFLVAAAQRELLVFDIQFDQ